MGGAKVKVPPGDWTVEAKNKGRPFPTRSKLSQFDKSLLLLLGQKRWNNVHVEM